MELILTQCIGEGEQKIFVYILDLHRKNRNMYFLTQGKLLLYSPRLLPSISFKEDEPF
jgi:hypothetical protein